MTTQPNPGESAAGGERAGTPCLICGRPVPDYVPEYCCNGFECGCHGQPSEPCVCSPACGDAVFSHIGKTMDERRQLAGIQLWGAPTSKDGEGGR